MKELTRSQRDSILKQVAAHPAKRVKLAVTDIDGILRGKYLHIDKFKSIVDSGFGFCDVVFGWDSNDAEYDNVQLTGWHSGYPDTPAQVDLNTYRSIPWNEGMPFFLCDFADGQGNAHPACPRNLLKSIRQEAISLGFRPIVGQEFEWFNFQETSEGLKDRSYIDPQPLTPGMFGYSILKSAQNSEYFNDLFDLMEKYGVPLEGLHTETGPGVYEAGILHDDILEAADRAVLFKTGVKEIAYQHGLIASFMAKWNSDLPGCSGHLHQSLWSNSKGNLFYDQKDPDHMSKLMKNYLAGLLHCLPEILPMYAPTVNSYKRLVEGAWAPTTVTWAVDNRTVAMRVLASGKQSARIENRVVGSDVNPYLAMAGSLASGLYGIQNKLELTQKPTQGNGYKDRSNGTLPGNLQEANDRMKQSGLAKQLFGKEFVAHFTQTREWEWRQFNKAVTNWEMKRYFEII